MLRISFYEQTLYPNTTVVSTNTGYARNYNSYPYGGYRTNTELIFNVSNFDSRLPPKKRVLGVIDGELAKFYPLSIFGDRTILFYDEFEGEELVVVGNNLKNFALAYKRILEDGTRLNLSAINGNSATIMEDDEGNKWNIFEEAIEGPRTGQRLVQTESYSGYFFTFGSFYPNPDIYTDNGN